MKMKKLALAISAMFAMNMGATVFAADNSDINAKIADLEQQINALKTAQTQQAAPSAIKFSGDMRVRWNNTEGVANGEMFKDRFRLNMNMKINDNTSVYARYVFDDDQFNQDAHQRLSDLAITTKGLVDKTDVTIGRYTLNLGPTTWFSGTTGDVDGITTNTKVDNVGLMLGYGQARTTINSLTANNLYIKNFNFAEGTYTAGKAKVNADYFKNLNVGGQDGQGHVVADAYNIFGGGLKYSFDSDWNASYEYYSNSADGAKLANGSSPTATIAHVGYKGAVASQPGTYGAFIEYTKFEGNSLPYAFAGPMFVANGTSVGLPANDGLKSYNFEYDYTMAKNVTFNLMYQFNIKDAVTGHDAPGKTFTRAQLNYMF